MREINKIYNENCIDTIKDISEKSVDVILTSPFYGTSRKSNTTLVQNNIGGGTTRICVTTLQLII